MACILGLEWYETRAMATSRSASPFSPERDHGSLVRLQQRLQRWLERDDAELFGVRAEVSGWSPAQHVYHVSLANEFSLQNVLSLVRGSGALVAESRGSKPEAEALLLRGRLPRGARAPRFVSPPARVDRAGLDDVVGGAREGLEAVGEVLPRVAGAPMIIPHQELGALDATRWLRFARLHTVHHLEILGAIARAGRRS